MRAAARIEVARRDGRDVLVDARSEPPMAIRRAGDRVLVVGSAAAPVGGDALTLDVVVGPAARLSLGTVAATMAWPGPHDAWSSQDGDGRRSASAATCAGRPSRWSPSPGAGTDRRRPCAWPPTPRPGSSRRCRSAAPARTPGRVDLEWRVERGGSVLLHHAERLGPGGPGWGSAVSSGRHRHLVAAAVRRRRRAGRTARRRWSAPTPRRPDCRSPTTPGWCWPSASTARPPGGALDAVADLGAPGLDVETVRAQVGR